MGRGRCRARAPRPLRIAGCAWELTLGWLLRDDLGADAVAAAVDEAVDRDNRSEPGGALWEPGIFCLYTAARGLCMFMPEDRDRTRPHLNAVGRSTAIQAVRAAVLAPGMGDVV